MKTGLFAVSGDDINEGYAWKYHDNGIHIKVLSVGYCLYFYAAIGQLLWLKLYADNWVFFRHHILLWVPLQSVISKTSAIVVCSTAYTCPTKRCQTRVNGLYCNVFILHK